MSDHQPLSRRAAKQAGKPARAPKARKASTVPAADGSTTEKGAKALSPRQRTTLIATALGVVFVMLSAGAVYAGVQVGSQPTETAPPVAEPIPERLVPLDIAQPATLRTCSVAELAENVRLGVFSGSVINIDTGEVLFDRDGDVGAAPGDIVKVLTGVAAIASLGPQFQFETKVFAGSEPGSIVLVGGGDPTLSRLPAGQESLYRGAPKLATLAAATQKKWDELNPPTEAPGPTTPPTEEPDPDESEDPEDPDATPSPDPSPSPTPQPTLVKQPITKVYYDTTAWSAVDAWNADWDSNALTQGSMPRAIPLMVDGDRHDPKSVSSQRSDDPAQRAARAFANALGLPGSTPVVPGAARPGAAELATVKSQQVHVLVRYMIAANDHTLAEMLARKVSSEAGLDGSGRSLGQVIPGAVAQLGLDGSQVSVVDGSGLSPKSTVPPRLVAQLMKELGEETGHQLAVFEPLAVAGESGALAKRFSGANEKARGSVKGMVGATKTARTLAGLIQAEDGTNLAFAFYALGKVDANAAAALDSLTAAVYSCGNSLSNY